MASSASEDRGEGWIPEPRERVHHVMRHWRWEGDPLVVKLNEHNWVCLLCRSQHKLVEQMDEHLVSACIRSDCRTPCLRAGPCTTGTGRPSGCIGINSRVKRTRDALRQVDVVSGAHRAFTQRPLCSACGLQSWIRGRTGCGFIKHLPWFACSTCCARHSSWVPRVGCIRRTDGWPHTWRSQRLRSISRAQVGRGDQRRLHHPRGADACAVIYYAAGRRDHAAVDLQSVLAFRLGGAGRVCARLLAIPRHGRPLHAILGVGRALIGERDTQPTFHSLRYRVEHEGGPLGAAICEQPRDALCWAADGRDCVRRPRYAGSAIQTWEPTAWRRARCRR